MRDSDHNHDPEIEALAAAVSDLRKVCERLTEENAELRAAMLGGTSSPTSASADSVTRSGKPRADGRRANGRRATTEGHDEAGDTAESEEPDRGEMSRRGMLRTAAGLAAAATVGGLIAEGARDPAAATDGGALVAGTTTTGELSTTVLYDGSSGFGSVVLLGNDSAYDPAGGAHFPAALGGWAGAGSTVGAGGVANGIYGYTDNGAGNGVVGLNSGATAGAGSGVYGQSDSTASDATAVYGLVSSTSPGGFSAAVRGRNNGTGGSGIGVWGSQAGTGWGVYGQCTGAGLGVLGVSNGGYGVYAQGGLAPLFLSPAGTAGPPTTGSHAVGEVYVDSAGRLYSCVTGGTPGTWVKLSPLVPVNPPKRAYDSRSHDGPLTAGSTRNVSLTSGGIPAGASLALINLTVVQTVGGGFLTLYEQGRPAPSPLTSNINWYASGQAVANNATVALSSSAQIAVYAGATTQFIIDVFGYYL
jgi:hypothetical protein